MSDFVKELNFDGDTFNDMKRDMNFVLQRLLGNMQEKECQEGTLTLKLDVSLVREYVPNYNPRDNTWIKDREKKMGHCSYRVNHAECRRTGARAFAFSKE